MSGEQIRSFGLDTSLSSTGVACVEFEPDGEINHMWTDRVAVSSRGCERIDEIVRRTSVLLSSARSDLPGASNGFAFVTIEGPIYRPPKLPSADGSRDVGLRGYHERAGLWWALVTRLKRAQIPFAVAPPSNIKKWATDNGNARKELVLLRIAREFPQADVESNDESDALVAALMGAHRMLGDAFPFGLQYRARALDGVEWPVKGDALGWAGVLAASAFEQTHEIEIAR